MNKRMISNVLFLIFGFVFVTSAIVMRAQGENLNLMALMAGPILLWMILTIGEIKDSYYKNS